MRATAAHPARPATTRPTTRPSRGCGAPPAIGGRSERRRSSTPAIAGDGGGVHLGGGDPAGARQLVQMAEQPEARDVGHRAGAGDQGRARGVAVELRHHGHRSRRQIRRSPARALPRWWPPPPTGFVSSRSSAARAEFRSRRSGCTVPVTAMPYLGSASSIECLRPRPRRRPPPRRPAAEDRAEHLTAERLERVGHQVERRDRLAAHRVDVRGERWWSRCVRSRRGRRRSVKKSTVRDQRELVGQAIDGGVVGRLHSNDEVRPRTSEALDQGMQVSRRQLARAAGAVRQARQLDCFHAPIIRRGGASAKRGGAPRHGRPTRRSTRRSRPSPIRTGSGAPRNAGGHGAAAPASPRARARGWGWFDEAHNSRS